MKQGRGLEEVCWAGIEDGRQGLIREVGRDQLVNFLGSQAEGFKSFPRIIKCFA